MTLRPATVTQPVDADPHPVAAVERTERPLSTRPRQAAPRPR